MKSSVIFATRTAKLRKPAVRRQFASHNQPTLTLITPFPICNCTQKLQSRDTRNTKDCLVCPEKASGNGALVYLLVVQLAMLSVAKNSLHRAEWGMSGITGMKRNRVAVVYWRNYLLEVLPIGGTT